MEPRSYRKILYTVGCGISNSMLAVIVVLCGLQKKLSHFPKLSPLLVTAN